MKKIYFVRHAKAENETKKSSDIERALNNRGKEDAQFMAKRLKKHGIFPDIIYTSSAKRALKTTKIFAEVLDLEKKKILEQDTLYASSLQEYLSTIHQIPNYYHSVVLVAHNPTITEAVEYLSGAILDELPTCAIVCIAFEVESFKEIKEESGHILFYDYPKKHKR